MNRIALLKKLQENRSFFFGIDSAKGKTLH